MTSCAPGFPPVTRGALIGTEVPQAAPPPALTRAEHTRDPERKQMSSTTRNTVLLALLLIMAVATPAQQSEDLKVLSLDGYPGGPWSLDRKATSTWTCKISHASPMARYDSKRVEPYSRCHVATVQPLSTVKITSVQKRCHRGNGFDERVGRNAADHRPEWLPSRKYYGGEHYHCVPGTSFRSFGTSGRGGFDRRRPPWP
jgi:hypothetical protein